MGISMCALAAQAQIFTPSVPQSGLIGYFAGNDNAQDSSSFHNDGLFPAGLYAAGQVGNAFDLSSGPVTIPNIPAYQITSDFSVDFWFKGGVGNGIAFLGQDEGGGGVTKWFVDYGYGHPGQFGILPYTQGDLVVFLPASPASFDPSQWNNLAVVKSESSYGFYLNGVAIGGQGFGRPFPTPSAPITLGYAEGGLSYSGALDEVVLYNRALSPTEVGQLAGITPVPEPAAYAAVSGLALLGFAAWSWRQR